MDRLYKRVATLENVQEDLKAKVAELESEKEDSATNVSEWQRLTVALTHSLKLRVEALEIENAELKVNMNAVWPTISALHVLIEKKMKS